jgi:ferritin-like metal-binding protein YciE
MAKKTKSTTTKSSRSSASSSGSGTSSSWQSDSDGTTSGKGRQRNEKTLEDLLETGLKDIYSAEKQLIEALPKMAKAADSEDLEEAFNFHLQQTKKQAERLEKIFDRLGIENDESEECEAMKGLIKEADEIISEFEAGPVRDAALIIAAQKVEHYEIASYGSLRELTDVLGMNKECDILDRSLQEEGDTDHNLSELAMQINDNALEEADAQTEE